MGNVIRAVGTCLLLCGVLLAGCGGDDDGTGGEGATAGAEADSGQSRSAGGSDGELEPTPESKEDYVAKANALCSKRRKQIQAELSEFFQEAQGDEAQRRAVLRGLVEETVAPGLKAEAEELRRLGAPQEDVGEVEAVIAAIEAVAAEARKDPETFAENPAALNEAQRLARSYGIGQCGRPT